MIHLTFAGDTLPVFRKCFTVEIDLKFIKRIARYGIKNIKQKRKSDHVVAGHDQANVALYHKRYSQ